MKIATYNLCFLFGEGEHKYAGAKWEYTSDFVEQRVNHFAKVFSEINADILFLQEVASEDVLKRIIQKSGIHYLYFIATPDNHGVGNAVIYKSKDCVCESVPARASLPVFFEGDEDTIGSRIWSRRDFVHLKTTYQGKILNCIGIHIKANFAMPEKGLDGKDNPMNTNAEVSDGFIRSAFFRLSQSRKVRQMVDDFFGEDEEANVIVLGDFNSDNKNAIFRGIQGNLKALPESLISASDTIPKEAKFSTVFRDDEKGLIDHILLSKNLNTQLVSAIILNRTLVARPKEVAPNPTYIESDHAPFTIELG